MISEGQMISGAHVIIYSKDRPCLKQQETFISFTIAPDGHFLAMRLEMKDSNLKLRAHFAVN
jgi:hypothetical protein